MWLVARRGAFRVGIALALAALACSGGHSPPEGDLSGPDGGDGGAPDAGSPDGGGSSFGGPGPWPLANATYGAGEGILEVPVVGTSTDETQNLWVATHQALYLLHPGEKAFRRYDAADGLHLLANPALYCNNAPEPSLQACSSGTTASTGAAVELGISEITGGGPNEVFVGYYGTDPALSAEDGTDWQDPGRHSGKIDRVRPNADGTLTVDRFDMLSGGHGAKYWHDRTVERLLYDHFIHPHTLYAGTNHGVDMFFPDKFRYARPGEWFDAANQDWMADHLHAHVCYHKPCDASEASQRMGDWRGLAVAPDGDLWHAGKWAAGLIKWDPVISDWYSRGGAAFAEAFGDPYPPVPPVFAPPQEGDAVNLSAVIVAKDGTVWFASEALSGTGVDATDYGVASWDGRHFTYYDPTSLGLGERKVRDLVALPDGRIVLAGPSSGLAIYDPTAKTSKTIRVGQGIPDDRVQRLELDTMVDPPALHVSTSGGAAVLRILP
jgi:hypothetical protein